MTLPTGCSVEGRKGMAPDFTEMNLRALHGRFPALAERMIRRERPAARVAVVATPSGSPSAEVVIAGGERIPLHSRRDPRREASRLQDEMRAGRVWFVVGFGLGYHVETLLAVGGEQRRVFLVEPDPDVFRTALAARDLTALLADPRLTLFVAESPRLGDARDPAAGDDGLEEAVAAWLERHWARSARRFVFPPSRRIDPEGAEGYAQRLEAACARFGSAVETHARLFHRCRGNHLRNLPRIAGAWPVTRLRDLAGGQAAVCVAAGPSLDRNVSVLAAAREGALILAVDSALPALAAHRITPDLVCALDAVPDKAHVLAAYSTPGTPLLAMEDAHPAIVAAHRGPVLFAGRGTELGEFLRDYVGENGAYPEEMTVANFAFSMARLLGCEPVVFVGLDLALTGGRMHASEVVEHWNFPDGMERVAVRGSVEPVVYTLPNLAVALDQFSRRVRAWPGRFIDATEGGAYVGGSVVMPLREAIERCCVGAARREALEGVRAALARRLSPDAEAADAAQRAETLHAGAARLAKTSAFLADVCRMAALGRTCARNHLVMAAAAAAAPRFRAHLAQDAATLKEKAQAVADMLRDIASRTPIFASGLADHYFHTRDLAAGELDRARLPPGLARATPLDPLPHYFRSAMRAANLLRRELGRLARGWTPARSGRET